MGGGNQPQWLWPAVAGAVGLLVVVFFVTQSGGDDKTQVASKGPTTTTPRAPTTMARPTTTIDPALTVLSCDGVRAAALGTTDLDTTWSPGPPKHPEFTSTDCVEVEQGGPQCRQMTVDDDIKPVAEWEADFQKRGETGRHVATGVSGYRDPAEAGRVIGLLRAGADQCRQVEGSGYKGTLEPVPFDKLGDDTIAFRLELTSPGKPSILADFVYIQEGTAVSFVGQYAGDRAGLDPAFLKSVTATAHRKLQSALSAEA